MCAAPHCLLLIYFIMPTQLHCRWCACVHVGGGGCKCGERTAKEAKGESLVIMVFISLSVVDREHCDKLWVQTTHCNKHTVMHAQHTGERGSRERPSTQNMGQ